MDFGVTDGEVDQGPAREAEQWLGGLAFRLRSAVEAVLVDGVADALGEVRLELDGGNRDAVEEEDQVEAVLVVQRVADLPHDAEAVGLVVGEDVLVQAHRGLEAGELERLLQAEEFDAIAEHIEGPALVELGTEAVEERRLGLAAVILREGLPGLGLSRLEPGDDVRRVESALAVVELGVVRRVEPVVDLEVLEVDLLVQAHGPLLSSACLQRAPSTLVGERARRSSWARALASLESSAPLAPTFLNWRAWCIGGYLTTANDGVKLA